VWYHWCRLKSSLIQLILLSGAKKLNQRLDSYKEPENHKGTHEQDQTSHPSRKKNLLGRTGNTLAARKRVV
jgi:hypothetical protein